ncbi:hypothetical protein GH714_000846 [Hevea brasiliensis]|uniref:NAC domain-containing protein n=1 Tax=Hevea brasiliensis TaxID=3981 RepID=A0A6A6L0V5_HEVBR|nr:hypothetical protein GH714_000846 [Hevea brasiliensis]
MEVKLYEYNPEKLQRSIGNVETEWYFFTPRDKRYPMEVDQNEMPVVDTGRQLEGIKLLNIRVLWLDIGRHLFSTWEASNGTKTNWIMHEYRLDNVVLCKIYKRDAKDNLRSRLSNEEQSAELDDQTADVVRDVDTKRSSAYTNALNDNKQIVSIPIQENPSAFLKSSLCSNQHHDHHQAMLEAANYQRAMFAAANYGSYRTYATVDIDHVKFNIRATEEPCHELFSPPISNNERRLSLSESSDADVDSENNPIGASGKRNENVSTSGLYLSEDNYIDHENSSATHDKQHQLLNQHHSRLSLKDSSATLAIQTDGDELHRAPQISNRSIVRI